jgi:hypothetical protein
LNPLAALKTIPLIDFTDCKGNLGIIGSFMTTVLLSSLDEDTFEKRRLTLQNYQRLLMELSGKFEFAALPSLRVNLIIERLFNKTNKDDFWDTNHEYE